MTTAGAALLATGKADGEGHRGPRCERRAGRGVAGDLHQVRAVGPDLLGGKGEGPNHDGDGRGAPAISEGPAIQGDIFLEGGEDHAFHGQLPGLADKSQGAVEDHFADLDGVQRRAVNRDFQRNVAAVAADQAAVRIVGKNSQRRPDHVAGKYQLAVGVDGVPHLLPDATPALLDEIRMGQLAARHFPNDGVSPAQRPAVRRQRARRAATVRRGYAGRRGAGLGLHRQRKVE